MKTTAVVFISLPGVINGMERANKTMGVARYCSDLFFKYFTFHENRITHNIFDLELCNQHFFIHMEKIDHTEHTDYDK